MIGAFSLSALERDMSVEVAPLLRTQDATFERVSTDTREIGAGDLFVALRGERFDGHDYLMSAYEAGASAALVEVYDEHCPLAQLQVADTVLGLGEIARLNRQRFDGPVVAITGSSGKTSVRSMVASILECEGPVLVTEGNLNNHIGVPLTLLRLDGSERFAVIEMGASGPGEIAYLCRLAGPDVGLVNNVMPAHLEGFGSVQGIADAKGEIYQGVGGHGVCVVNLDDAFAGQWLHEIGSRASLTFSEDKAHAQCVAGNVRPTEAGIAFDMTLVGRNLPIELAVPGRHNLRNALAAACCAHALGVGDHAIAEGLAAFRPVAGRLRFARSARGARVIDDAYNANPGSVRAAIDVLAEQPGQRILVMGDMGELGDEAESMHGEIGAYAAGRGLDAVYTVGRLSKRIGERFGGPGQHFTDQQALIELLKNECDNAGSALLIKGSRSARMDRVVSALLDGETD